MTKGFFLGVHVSISGGLHLAPVRAAGLGCNAMQIFSHSPRSWRYKSPTDDEIELFKEKIREYKIERFFVHSSYLINLCSENSEVREKSEKLLLYEAHLSSRLGADALILHPGRAGGGDPQGAVKMIARSLDRVGEEVGKPVIALETTAGQSGELGSTIEGLGEIIDRTKGVAIRGICIDTCHLFA
ncbi:MAG: deoxyribonuclease IV, partial [Nitrospirae bacterium]